MMLLLFVLGATARITQYGRLHGLKEIVPVEQEACCSDRTEDCLKCKFGLSKKEFREEFPTFENCLRTCCSLDRAFCYACQVCNTVSTFCAKVKKSIMGCPSAAATELAVVERKQPRLGCGRGPTAENMACQMGITEGEFDNLFPKYDECGRHLEGVKGASADKTCPHGHEAVALMCQVCIDSLSDFCDRVFMYGCPGWKPNDEEELAVVESEAPKLGCGRGPTATNMACQMDIPLKEFDELFPNYSDCGRHFEGLGTERPDKTCPHGHDAGSLMCQTCVDSLADFCGRVFMYGCPGWRPETEELAVVEKQEPKLGCGRGPTATNMACQMGIPVKEFDELFPNYSDCGRHLEGLGGSRPDKTCPHGHDAGSLMCQTCVDSLSDFCGRVFMYGCPGWRPETEEEKLAVVESEAPKLGCGRGPTAENMACQMGITESEFDNLFPKYDDCGRHLEGVKGTSADKTCPHGHEAVALMCQVCVDSLSDFCDRVFMYGCPGWKPFDELAGIALGGPRNCKPCFEQDLACCYDRGARDYTCCTDETDSSSAVANFPPAPSSQDVAVANFPPAPSSQDVASPAARPIG